MIAQRNGLNVYTFRRKMVKRSIQ
ncbi:hypothetical protein ACEWLV_10045 [Lactiplantibacillus plantarum]